MHRTRFSTRRATEFNVPGKHGRRNDTGVRFSDVAGIQEMKDDMIATLRTLMGAEEYKRLGCNPPRVSIYTVSQLRRVFALLSCGCMVVSLCRFSVQLVDGLSCCVEE